MAELRIVVSTQWVSVRGMHPGALIEVRRVTPNAVYYRTIREGAGTGPRHRRGGPKNRLDHAEFLLNYRPNTKRDWMLAAQGSEPEEHPEGTNGTVTTEDLAATGRLHADEEAIAQAIRDGAKYHDVQRDYKVAGKILHEIITKFGVPYTPVRTPRTPKAEEAPVEVPAAASETPELLHPQELEIVELMRARAGTFQDVIRDYHLSSRVLSAIMARHAIPKQTAEEKRIKSLAHYHRKRQERLEREAAEAAELVSREEPVAASAPAEASPPVVAPAVASVSQVGLHRWHVTVRTVVLQTYVAADYLSAAQSALAANPQGAEIIVLIQAEGSAT